MATTIAHYSHLTIDADGAVRVTGSRYKVLHLAGEHYHYGWTAEEILRQHPDLRPEEVYSALAYFYDHYDEMTARLNESTDVGSSIARDSTVTRDELLRRNASKGG